MSRFTVPNLAYIRSDDKKYSQTFQAVSDAINRLSDQTNADPTGAQVATPPQVSGLSVVESGGIHDVQITDQSPAYAGIQYSAEYSQTSDFQNSHKIDLGTSQNHRANLGAGQYFWRASSSYHPATPSPHVYHGGATPQAVGSGAYPGPPMQQGQGFSGQYRSSTTPPVRK
jgi:hypothetical protein